VGFEQSEEHLKLLVVFEQVSLVGHEGELEMIEIVDMDQKISSAIEENSSVVGPVFESS